MIVTTDQNDLFTRKIDQFHPKTEQFGHFFGVKNVRIFSNSSRRNRLIHISSFTILRDFLKFTIYGKNASEFAKS